jgi:hypothetical protein
MTVLDHLISVLHDATTYNRHDVAPPRVLLWPDGESLWLKAAGILSKSRQGFFQWDANSNGDFSGTAVWVRYQLGKYSGSTVPVLYLPGIHRHQFRGAAGFPEDARHLFALQYEGQFFGQSNGKDWTPLAFLGSDSGGLGLDVARDRATQEALGNQLVSVLRTPVTALQGRKLEVADFHELAASDPVQLLLEWIGGPEQTTAAWTSEQQSAFQAITKREFEFDPVRDGLLIAAEKLSRSEGAWNKVWTRLAEAPASHPGVLSALESVQPEDLFGATNLRLPATNKKQEEDLRQALIQLGSLPAADARKKIESLYKQHAPRLETVWAKIGQAPLALALRHLRNMANAMNSGLKWESWDALAVSYLYGGWTVDAEARKAWAAARRTEDAAAVQATLRATYLPWLEETARETQARFSSYPMHEAAQAVQQPPLPGKVYLFVDGLRADVASELFHAIDDGTYKIETSHRWVALPTVTATAKPAWKPLADHLTGALATEGFEPTLAESGKPCTTVEFRKLLSKAGFSWIDPATGGDPATCGWTECGSLDTQGHNSGAKLAWRIEEEIALILQRIEQLSAAGWKTIHIITDHGWLWMPGGLPKTELPSHLTASKWGRCARPEPSARHTLQQVPWFWAGEHPIVLAPGVQVFKEGTAYTHGGLSVQEALICSLKVTPQNLPETSKITIRATKWAGLKLNVQVSSAESGLTLDIRSKAADASSSILTEKQRNKTPESYDGKYSVFVENDSLEGQSAVLVLLKQGSVIAKKPITIGED